MRLLLDTHIAFWAVTDSPRLPAAARRLILSTASRIFVSAGSVWDVHTNGIENFWSLLKRARFLTVAGRVCGRRLTYKKLIGDDPTPAAVSPALA